MAASPGPTAPLRLVTLPISHYCEKARWALERAGIAYREERHVQGVHRIAARRGHRAARIRGALATARADGHPDRRADRALSRASGRALCARTVRPRAPCSTGDLRRPC